MTAPSHPHHAPHAAPHSAPHGARRFTAATVALLGALLLLALVGAFVGEHDGHAAPHAPPWWALGVLPFALLLLCIAALPLVPRVAGWWHSNLNRLLLSLVAAVLAIGYLVGVTDTAVAGHAVKHALLDEYVPFMVLLFSLYVITGGIAIHGNLPATPAVNTSILLIGALLASVLGTTGASMLLIRPLLQTNRERTHKVHTVVFFIFIVSNIGGSLLPVGDPPLFLGYLRGVPFLWTLSLWREWLLMSAALLAIYYVWDRRMHAKESPENIRRDFSRIVPERVDGALNFVWLLAVLLAVAFVNPARPLPGTGWTPPEFFREALMLAATGLSLLLTPRQARSRNEFNYAAILEVAAIFIGIFVTMQVPLMVLREHGAALGIDTPAKYFWATGILSSFLDNAPTYGVFFETALTVTEHGRAGNIVLLDGDEIDGMVLQAISVGAVFMGANTYIGNGPNFMVKSIADASGVRMPSFFGYMGYSAAILLPLFVVQTFLFFW